MLDTKQRRIVFEKPLTCIDCAGEGSYIRVLPDRRGEVECLKCRGTGINWIYDGDALQNSVVVDQAQFARICRLASALLDWWAHDEEDGIVGYWEAAQKAVGDIRPEDRALIF